MEKPKRAKRDLILDTAFQLFVEKGYLDTKVIDIAEAAGIGKGTVYEYFTSKETLFAELLTTHVLNHYIKQTEQFVNTDDSCEEQLRQYIFFEREIACRFGNGKNYIDSLSLESGLFEQPELKKVVDKLLTLRFNTIHSIICNGIARGEFAPLNSVMVTFSLMGALCFFLSYNYSLLSRDNATRTLSFSEKEASWNEDDFLLLLFDGLLISTEPTK